MSDETPRVNLSFDVHWCARHLAPLRPEWPTHATVAMTELFSAAVALPAVADACPTVDGKPDATYLDQALRRFSPLCCFLPAPALREVYRKAGVTT